MTIQRASVYHGQPYRYEEDTQAYDDAAPPRKPTSAINYTRTRTTDYAPVIRSGNRRYILHEGLPPPRKTPLSSQAEEEVVRPRRRVHWLVFVGLFMLTMLIGWVGLTMLANWWQVTQDDWHYGRPRTYQTDMVVGHNDSAGSPSHFIAINYNRHIEIIEFPGGDISHAKLYLGPSLFGDGEDLAVVTVSFKDVNGDGKPDMIINVANTHIIYINDNGQFRPLKPGEQVNQ